MRRAATWASLVLIVGALAAGHATVNSLQMPIEGQDTHARPAGQIVGGETVGQTFLARYNHLDRIDVFLGTFARPNTQEVIFHLQTAPDASDDIFRLSFNASEVEDYAYRSFTFPPIPDSAGRTFYFYLESPTSVEGDAITVWMQPRDLYPQGEMYRNGTPVGGDLCFLAHYQGSYWDKATALLDRLTENKPSIWGKKWLYVLLGLTTVGSAVWLLYQTAALLFEDKAS